MSRGKRRSREIQAPGQLKAPEPLEMMKMVLRMAPIILIEQIPKKVWENDAKDSKLKGLEKDAHIAMKKARLCRMLGDVLIDEVVKAKKKEGKNEGK